MSFQSRRAVSRYDLFVSQSFTKPRLRERLALTWAIWRERVQARRCLARLDARSLREIGISPAAAAFESGKPFWRQIGPLR